MQYWTYRFFLTCDGEAKSPEPSLFEAWTPEEEEDEAEALLTFPPEEEEDRLTLLRRMT